MARRGCPTRRARAPHAVCPSAGVPRGHRRAAPHRVHGARRLARRNARAATVCAVAPRGKGNACEPARGPPVDRDAQMIARRGRRRQSAVRLGPGHANNGLANVPSRPQGKE
ncbi:hypothetical protein BCEN4_880002 [Burkholderia cenocepacia]|nr:hypothetical protein BCEN4_880002 [Burkholderia cenocepacia]